MSDERFDDYNDASFTEPDIMDKIGDSFSSVFARRSRENDKADELLYEFTSKDSDDDYELFVDERVEQKRAKKEQKQIKKIEKKSKPKAPVSPLMRRIRSIITYCIIVAVVLIACVVLSLTVLFKTQNYEVNGVTKYSQQEIIETCGIGGNDNIFLANKSAAEKRLVKKFPYIEEAQVSFAIPDTITIDITEAVPAYIIKESDKKYIIASSQGRILEVVKKIKGHGLPLFLGADVKNDEVGSYVEYNDETTFKIIDEIVTVFADNGYSGITEIDATDAADISFTYDDRIKVKLGLPEDISYKIRTAMTIINDKLDLNGAMATAGELDVSDCNETKKSYFREQSLIESQVEINPPKNTITDDDTDTDGDGEVDEEPQEETQPELSQDDWYL